MDSLGAFFDRFDHPWLAALAAAGAIWFLASFPLGLVGAWVHPGFNLLAALLHVLGGGTLLLSGLVFAILWWKSYLDWKFFSGPGGGSPPPERD